MSEHTPEHTPEHPHWEHGYRCHGYWLGTTRWGFVGIGPPGFPPNDPPYGWSFDEWGLIKQDEHYSPDHKGHAKTLRAAKRKVEAAYRAWVAVNGVPKADDPNRPRTGGRWSQNDP